MKGNRQGSLSRSITRRSDQNRKIKYCFLFCAFQLVKKVRSDFFDKLRETAARLSPLFYFGSGFCRGRRPRRPGVGADDPIRPA